MQHVSDIPNYLPRLQELVLGGSFRVRDETVASAVAQLPQLKKFHYHHSLAVGKELLSALGKSRGEHCAWGACAELRLRVVSLAFFPRLLTPRVPMCPASAGGGEPEAAHGAAGRGCRAPSAD